MNRYPLKTGGVAIWCHHPLFRGPSDAQTALGSRWLTVVVLGSFAGVLAFDAPAKPPTLASISKPFADVDFGDLPVVQTYAARDGAKLGYRFYKGSGAQVIVLIHGSSDDGAGMHPLAKALREAGGLVYVPVLRGHGNFGAISAISVSLRMISPISSQCYGRSTPTPAFH